MFKFLRRLGGVVLVLGALFSTAIAATDSLAPHYQIPYQIVAVQLSEDAVTMQQSSWAQPAAIYDAAGNVVTDSPAKGRRVRVEVDVTAVKGDLVKAYYNQFNDKVESQKPTTYTGQPRVSKLTYVAGPFLLGTIILIISLVTRARRRKRADAAAA